MRRRVRSFLIAAQTLLMLAGLALIARPAYHWARRTVAAAQARYLWAECRRRGPGQIADGAPAAWLQIPAAGINTLVLRGPTPANLHRFPCLAGAHEHPFKVIFAHRDIHFRRLGSLRPGDPVTIESVAGNLHHYRVCETETLSPAQLHSRLNSKSSESWLVLVTCYPFRYIGPAPLRYLIWARPEAETLFPL